MSTVIDLAKHRRKGASDLGRQGSQVSQAAPAAPAPVTLRRSAQLDLEQAELFLLSLDQEMSAASAPRAAYLLGLAEGHLANLIELARGLTR